MPHENTKRTENKNAKAVPHASCASSPYRGEAMRQHGEPSGEQRYEMQKLSRGDQSGGLPKEVGWCLETSRMSCV